MHSKVKEAYARFYEAELRLIEDIKEIFPIGKRVYWLIKRTNTQNIQNDHMQSGRVIGYRPDGYVQLKNDVTKGKSYINPLRLEMDDEEE